MVQERYKTKSKFTNVTDTRQHRRECAVDIGDTEDSDAIGHNTVQGSSQKTCGETDAVIARSGEIFPYERHEERLQYVKDCIGQVFAGVEDTVDYTFDLVDNYRINVRMTCNKEIYCTHWDQGWDQQ